MKKNAGADRETRDVERDDPLDGEEREEADDEGRLRRARRPGEPRERPGPRRRRPGLRVRRHWARERGYDSCRAGHDRGAFHPSDDSTNSSQPSVIRATRTFRVQMTADVTPRLLTERAAIVHDWFQGYHGSERVVEAMRTGLFTTPRGPTSSRSRPRASCCPPGSPRAIVRESRLARLPGHPPGRPRPGPLACCSRLHAALLRRLDLDAYDLVISSSHAFAVERPAARGRDSRRYCHTPIRYAWMPETEARRVGGLRGAGLRAMRGRLRRIDRAAARRPDGYVAISDRRAGADPALLRARRRGDPPAGRRRRLRPARPRRSRATSSGCTGSSPTSVPRSWSRLSAGCRTG